MDPQQYYEQLAKEACWLHVLGKHADGEGLLAAGEWNQAHGAWDALRQSDWVLAA